MRKYITVCRYLCPEFVSYPVANQNCIFLDTQVNLEIRLLGESSSQNEY